MAANLRRAADGQVPDPDSLKRMIFRWEREGLTVERYELLYALALGIDPDDLAGGPPGMAPHPEDGGHSARDIRPLALQDDPPGLIETGTVIRPGGGPSFDATGLADRMSELINWAEGTNVGDGTLSYLDDAAMQLAHDCLTVSPVQTSERADVLANRVFDILRSGRQRLAQTRDLYVIAGKLCALLSWLSSDLGQLSAADAHARNGWALADQADHDGLRALLLSVQSKNDYWRRRYSKAAMHARRGYDYNPPGTLRVLLACQEADALQAMGKVPEALEVLTRSERTRDAVSQMDELVGGIFGCGIARQSNYSISTHLRAGSVDQALWHVERAETAWSGGEEWAYGTWAQVQIGAAVAHLMNGEVEGAAMLLRPILDQPADRRLATLTTRLRREVTPFLAAPAVRESKFAVALREGITDYGKSPIGQLTTGMEL